MSDKCPKCGRELTSYDVAVVGYMWSKANHLVDDINSGGCGWAWVDKDDKFYKPEAAQLAAKYNERNYKGAQ
jgi:hypothetical protein